MIVARKPRQDFRAAERATVEALEASPDAPAAWRFPLSRHLTLPNRRERVADTPRPALLVPRQSGTL